MLSDTEDFRIFASSLSPQPREYFFPYNSQTSANDNDYILYILPNTFHFVFLSVQNFVPDSITTWEVQAISISPQKGISIGYFIWFLHKVE